MPPVATLRARALSAADFVYGLPVLRQDALLYALAGLFSIGEILRAITADYREWGELSVVPYFLAALLCELAFRSRRRRRGAAAVPDESQSASRLRKGIAVGLLGLVVLVPLGLQVTWRAQATTCVTNPHGAQAQPEVAVIERAGDRLAAYKDPYLSHPTSVGVSPSNDCAGVNAGSFFPYLPGMIPFGLANAFASSHRLGDARLALAGFTLVVVLLALGLVRASGRRRWRAFQFLIVLPTGALIMVTGGDDLPVLALLLLGLVLLGNRRPVWAGLVMGFAGSLKWTAWPLIVLGVLCARTEEERPAGARYLLSVLAVSVPVIGAGVALGPHAFLENVVYFPLGLTKVHSPAASPLPGQVLVQLLPGFKKPLTYALVGLGAVAVVVMLVRHPPRSPYEAARFAGWALAFATFIAPATRFGYLIYPANMLVWAYLLHDRPPPVHLPAPVEAPAGPRSRSERQLASPTW